jgi:16S rRNA processing protein RimM
MTVVSNEEWNLTIGEIVAPFGLAGDVKVRLETDFPERFARLKQVCLRWPTGKSRLFDVEAARLHKGQILLKLRGVATIDAAETLRNSFVQVRVQEAVPLPAGEFYIYDLIGCEVVTVEDRLLGTVTSVLRGGIANDVFVIGEGKNELLLPMVRDVVRDIDIVARRIVVSPTPGLLPGESEEA